VGGNSESATTVVEAALESRARGYRWDVGLNGTQASESGEEKASSWLAQASYDHFIAPKRFLYGRGSVERNRYAGFALRTTLGMGYGVQLREDDLGKASIRGGIEAMVEDRSTGPTDSHPALGWGVRLARHVLDRRAELFHEQDGYWNVEEESDVTLRTRSGVRIPLLKGLSVSAQLNLDWEGEPEEGREATDTTLLLGVGYNW
jgi:putative salt-induced outer membrane protein YdiY